MKKKPSSKAPPKDAASSSVGMLRDNKKGGIIRKKNGVALGPTTIKCEMPNVMYDWRIKVEP